MLPARRIAAVALVTVASLVLAACSSGTSGQSVPARDRRNVDPTTTTTAPAVTPLAVGADGMVDPAKVDLSGVEGVTPEEQARAEDLLRRTILTLPKWADPARAVADGFQSIGDGVTGEEHLLHWDWIDDSVMLDPSQPEALVYRVSGGTRTLDAAMFVLPRQYTLDTLPDVGGKLVQFHVHDDLCFTAPPAPKVAGITSVGGSCNAPLVKFNPNVMMHVWIRPNPCGPFAALQGIGAGQIKAGETRACDHEHGRLGL